MEKDTSFASEVRSLIEEKRMEYIDAIVHWCDLNGVEVEYAASLVQRDAAMLFSIQTEAEDLNYLKKTARLPV